MSLEEAIAINNDKWQAIEAKRTMRILNTTENGLTKIEAQKRLDALGCNELREEKKHSPIIIFFEQFKNFLIILLIIAAIISTFVGEIIDSVVILIIVFLSALMGFFQEYKAEKSLEVLKRMAAPTAHVIREAEEIEVPVKKIVPGDIITLRTGDKVPADGRLFKSTNLQIDESSLTGESVPVEKNSLITLDEGGPVSDRKNMVYSATSVTSGKGKAIVTSTGMNSEFGKIASMMQSIERTQTPLEIRLSHVGKWLGGISLLVVSIVSAIGIIKGQPLLKMFLWGVALAVAAVPEALPAVVTGSLAIGVQRMVGKKVIVRKLPAVETLGRTTIICSDKTGTLTKNEMTVRKIYFNNREIEVSGVGFDLNGNFVEDSCSIIPNRTIELDFMLKIGVLCNDASLNPKNMVGDPTEIALLVAAAKANIFRSKLEKEFPRIDEISFTSERKMMTTIHEEGKQKIICVKGAPESLLSISKKILKNGKQVEMTKEEKLRINTINEKMASEGLRILGMAFKKIDTNSISDLEKLEKDLVFVGLQGLIDAPREDAIKAIEVCKEAGIRVVMITGDHKLTAQAVAKELGIDNFERSLTGSELEKMTHEELENIVEEIGVYARVTPTHKMMIVSALKKKGHIVAVTGDRVNDAPALKKSDIGVAMGITGTEVTKEASDMILTDDNFASIVAAIEEGRNIFDNIKKYLSFLLSCNVGEILIMFAAGVLGWPLPLITIHLLWVNLVTDGLPAIALGVDPLDPYLMKRSPLNQKEGIFNKRVKILILGISIIIALIILPTFIWGLEREDLIYAQTLALTTLVMVEMFNVFNFRSLTQSISKIGIFSNKWLIFAVISSILMHLGILYIPGMAQIFSTRSIILFDWPIILILATLPLILIEFGKYIAPKIQQNKIYYH